MFGVGWLEWFIVGLYFVLITIMGVWAAKRVKSAASFFISDRKFGKIMMIFYMFGAGTHTDQAVGVASKTYRVGASGIWYQWQWLFCTPFFWIIAPFFRRMRIVTTGDYFDARYGRGTAGLYAAMAVLHATTSIGVMLLGTAKVITALTGGQISLFFAIMSMTVVFVIYGVAGGLAAAILTNFVQGILTIVLSFIILPFALFKVGGMAGLHETIANPDMLKIVAPEGVGVFFITMISIIALISWGVQSHTMSACAAGRTELEGRLGVTVGMFLKRFCTVAWCLTGLCGLALYANLKEPDEIYGRMAGDILPNVLPGLLGLFIASMLAAVMSSCDSLMVSGAGLFTENVYRKFIVANKPDSHYVLVGRISSVLVVAVALIFAFSLENVVRGVEVLWKVAALMGIPFLVGLFWRRATVAGAWAGALASFFTWLFTERISVLGREIWNFNEHFADKLPAFLLFNGELYLPWQIVGYLAIGFIAVVLVSLFTKPVPKERLDRLYECLRTPIKPGEPEPDQPFTLPPGVEPAPRNTLIQHPDFEIPRPSFIGMAGFIISWIAVVLIIVGFFWILN